MGYIRYITDRSVPGNGRFCNLPTAENDVLSEKKTLFIPEMQSKAASPCDKSIRTRRKDGALTGNKAKKSIKTLWKAVNGRAAVTG